MSAFIPPPERPAWQTLAHLAQRGLPHLRDLLQDRQRSASMVCTGAGLTLDHSRQRVTAEVLGQLLALARDSQVREQLQAMLRGEPINATENCPVLHMALRGIDIASPPWGQAISKQIRSELDRVCQFAEQVHAGHLTGFSDQTITHVVNLGIGGSDLGPRMATTALAYLTRESFERRVRVHYVSNVDAWDLHTVLAELDPARTVFIVQSKSFTTQETMTLAASARRWLLDGGCPEVQLARH